MQLPGPASEVREKFNKASVEIVSCFCTWLHSVREREEGKWSLVFRVIHELNSKASVPASKLPHRRCAVRPQTAPGLTP